MSKRIIKTPPRLRVNVAVTRGDVALAAETTAASALDVTRFLASIIQTVTKESPDLLPHADQVPGGAIDFTWGDHEGGEDTRRGVGFRRR
jgi:hypothetical protein